MASEVKGIRLRLGVVSRTRARVTQRGDVT